MGLVPGTVFIKCPTTGFRNRSFLPPDWVGFTQDANAGYRLAWYYPEPDGLPVPRKLYQCSIHFTNNTFTASTDAYSDNDDETITCDNGEELGWYALKAGKAVCRAQVPAYRSGTNTFAAVDLDGSTSITNGTHNLVHMPGTLGRYYEGGTLAAIDGNGGKKYLNAFNAVVMLIQHVRYHAELFQIDPEA